MNILALDTTSDNLVVALSKDGKLYSHIGEKDAKRHNSQLLPSIEELLAQAKLDIKDVDSFACVVGPGSFTGIRIGVSCVNAICFALGKKSVAITSFEELAWGIERENFYCAIDCRHDSFYYARFHGSYKNVMEMGENSSAELKEKDVIYKSAPARPQALIEIAKDKIAAGKFEKLSPLYLKKSQAEREYESKNMDKTV